jgi:hypothetical protein
VQDSVERPDAELHEAECRTQGQMGRSAELYVESISGRREQHIVRRRVTRARSPSPAGSRHHEVYGIAVQSRGTKRRFGAAASVVGELLRSAFTRVSRGSRSAEAAGIGVAGWTE